MKENKEKKEGRKEEKRKKDGRKGGREGEWERWCYIGRDN